MLYGSAKENFDRDYRTVVKLVIQGKMTKERAKIWIRETGQKVIASQQQMRDKFAKADRSKREVKALDTAIEKLGED